METEEAERLQAARNIDPQSPPPAREITLETFAKYGHVAVAAGRLARLRCSQKRKNDDVRRSGAEGHEGDAEIAVTAVVDALAAEQTEEHLLGANR